MRTPLDIRVFQDAEELAIAGAGIVSDVAAGVTADSKRHFAIALAGGSTPRRLYQELAAVHGVDWTKWEIFWSDERWVADDDRESNVRMARESLLANVAVPAEQLHPVPTHLASPADTADAYNDELIRVLGPEPVLDLVILGLGSDGHTASLFPQTDALEEHHRAVVANWVPHLNAHRITFTYPTINSARHVMFVVTGSEKAPMVRRVLEPADRDLEVPVARVRPIQGAVHWLLDRDAASQLSTGVAVPK